MHFFACYFQTYFSCYYQMYLSCYQIILVATAKCISHFSRYAGVHVCCKRHSRYVPPPQPRLEDLYADLSNEEYNQLLLPQGNIPLLNTQNLVPPKNKTPREQMFVASDSPDDSDWFVLDDAGRRVMKNRVKEVTEEITEEVTEAPEDNEMQEGGFMPITGPLE